MKRLFLPTILFIFVMSIGITSAQNAPVVLQVAVSDFAEDALELAVDAFEQQNPTVQVQLVTYDGFGFPANPNDDAETYQDELAAYFQLADVVLVNDNMTVEATRAGYALDLTPLTQSDPNYNATAYNATMADAFSWDFGQWALPISATFTTLSYSTDAFDAVGLNYPNNNWTLDDLIFAAQTLTQYNADGSIAMPGLILQGGDSVDALLMSAYGQPVVDDSTFPSVPNYGDPALATLLEQWYIFESEGFTTLPDGVNNTEVPMQIGNPQQGGGGGRFGNNNDQTRNATALLPGGASIMNVTGYAVSSGTNYPMQAYELAQFLTVDANTISVSGGTVPALINAPDTEQNGRGGGQDVTEAFEPLVETAILNGLNQADMRFSAGVADALDLIENDALTASDALTTSLDEQVVRLVVADERAQTTTIVVNAPEIIRTVGAGEIVLDFAVLAGGGGRGGGGVIDTWETLAEEFALQDSQVALINVEQTPPNVNALPETTQCYYSSTNIVGDLDLSTVLSLDPLLLSDPNFNSNDYVAGVLQQVQVNGMTYAMPVSITPLVLRVSPDSFNQAGVAIPSGSWTVSEFEDALRQLTSVVDADVAPFAITGSTPLITLITIYGGQPFDITTEPMTLNFTDPATVAAIEQVLTLAESGLISYSQGGGGGNNSPIIEQSLSGNIGGGGGGNNANANRVTVSFPIGTQSNAVAFDLGTMYISSDAQDPDACYRFMSYVAQNADIFDTMPVTQTLLNSSNLVNSQGQATVDFYQATADLLAQPTTTAFPTNIDQLGFGMTQWLTAVFDSYLNGDVISLEDALADAQQRTSDYLSCVDAIEIDFANGNFQDFQIDVQACVTAANA